MIEEELLPLCECGCGLRVTKKENRFIHNHHMRGVTRTLEHSAAISAATFGVPKPPRTPEHSAAISKALTDVPHSPEHNTAISEGLTNSDAVKTKADAQRGVPLPPETCAKISDRMKNSEAVKAEAERQRGGNDIVGHHFIYDHADLSLNTVKMTRSDHAKLHALLRKLSYIVPHVNVPDE